MKIAFPLLSFRKHGGVRVLSILMNELVRKGHEVYLVVPSNASENFYPLDERVQKIFTGPIKKTPFSILKVLFQLFLKTPKVDYVVVSFFPTFYLALLHKIFKKSKVIYYRQGVETLFYPFPLSEIARLTYYLPQDYSPSVSSWVKRKTGGKGPIIHPPLDNVFLNAPYTNVKNVQNILIFFKWDKKKGPGKALEIITNESFNKFNFYVVGENPLVAKANVKYLGFVKDMVELYDQCGFVILTSKFEGFGLPTMEGMARGAIPIVFTPTGPKDFIKHGVTGFFVKNKEEILHILSSLSQDKQKFEFISKNCIEKAKEYTISKFSEYFFSIIES